VGCASGRRKRAPLAARRCLAACVSLAVALAGCANVSREAERAPRAATRSSASGQRVHVVRAGETLYKIAWQYRVDQRDLQRWNGIRDPDVIRVGQRLRLTPPAAARARSAPAPAKTAPAPANRSARRASPAPAPRNAAPPVPPAPVLAPPVWAWPADGPIVSRFGTSTGISTGIGIGGRAGQPVRAAAAGRVVYAGSGLIGYGQLVIIKHNETYLTAYGYNSALLVTQGQDVARGYTIAQMGTGPERQARLHFEIRRNGVPVDPLQFFPGR
jgi:lipoprotein NlpD